MWNHCTLTVPWLHLAVCWHSFAWKEGDLDGKGGKQASERGTLESRYLRAAQCLSMVLYVNFLRGDVDRSQRTAFEEGLMNHSNKGYPEFFQMGTL